MHGKKEYAKLSQCFLYADIAHHAFSLDFHAASAASHTCYMYAFTRSQTPSSAVVVPENLCQ